jgi:hypothetical protein
MIKPTSRAQATLKNCWNSGAICRHSLEGQHFQLFALELAS